MKKLLKLRKKFLNYEEAEKIQKELIAIYKKEYGSQHTKEEYFDLIMKWNVGEIEERHPQSAENYPDKVFECFSVVSQHVKGYTKEHCLDQIWDAVEAKKKRIKRYKTLPTLEELVGSDIEINPEEMYETKEKGEHEDSCDGHSGGIILEMREIGIEESRKKSQKKAWDSLTNSKNRSRNK